MNMKLNKAKCKVLNLGQDNPKHGYRMRKGAGCRAALRRRTWAVGWWEPGNVHLQIRKPAVSWLHQKRHGQQYQGGDSAFQLCPHETSAAPDWGPQHWWGTGIGGTEKLSHPWKSLRQCWLWLWATWSNGSCPFYGRVFWKSITE